MRFSNTENPIPTFTMFTTLLPSPISVLFLTTGSLTCVVYKLPATYIDLNPDILIIKYYFGIYSLHTKIRIVLKVILLSREVIEESHTILIKIQIQIAYINYNSY